MVKKCYYDFFVASKLSEWQPFWVQNTSVRGMLNFSARSLKLWNFTKLLKVFWCLYMNFWLSLTVSEIAKISASVPSIPVAVLDLISICWIVIYGLKVDFPNYIIENFDFTFSFLFLGITGPFFGLDTLSLASFSNSSINEWSKILFSDSQVLYLLDHPSHFTRYSEQPFQCTTLKL